MDIQIIHGQVLCPTCTSKIFVEKPIKKVANSVENGPEFLPGPFD